MKVLLMCLGGIGDFIEAVPSIKALRESGRQDYLALIVAERVWPYASRCPYVDRVYSCPVPGNGKGSPGWLSAGANLLGLGLRLRLERFDWLLNFMDIGSPEGSRRMKRFIDLLGPAVSGGRNREGFGYFFDRQVEEKTGDGKSDAEYFHAVAMLAGKTLPAPEPPDLWISDEELGQADEILETIRRLSALNGERQSESPVILIHPGSDRQTRLWFPQRFAQTASELCNRLGARIIIVGGPQDEPIASEIAKLARPFPVRAFAGLRSIGTLAAMIKKADLVICNDSMAIHVAAAAGAPCVAVCASGDIGRDRPPWNRERLELLWKPLECSPCYFSRCPRNHYMECMERISVEEVVQVSERLLAMRPLSNSRP